MRFQWEAGCFRQAGQAIPGNFSDNDNCYSKSLKSSKTKMTWLEDKTFVTPGGEVHFGIAIMNSGTT